MGLLARRRTEALGALAVVTCGALGAVEARHIWRRGAARETAHEGHYVRAGQAATRDAVAVVREGYSAGSSRENTLFNMLAAFLATFGGARAVTALIRAGAGPFGNLVLGRRHIHHFVPGIVIALAAGGTSLATRHEDLDKWLAVPFGAGAALIFDEAALLLELEDVYWSREGVVSIQITLAAAALLASLGLGARLLRRGEQFVLERPEPPTT